MPHIKIRFELSVASSVLSFKFGGFGGGAVLEIGREMAEKKDFLQLPKAVIMNV